MQRVCVGGQVWVKMSTPDYHQEAKHLDDWIRWTYRENNCDKLSEIYRSLPKVLDTIFELWVDSTDPAVLADILALLLPGYADTLFAVLWREEAKFMRCPFNLRKLPEYARWLLKRRNAQSGFCSCDVEELTICE